MSIARHHTEWLSLIEISGPFLSLPVLLRALPQGLDARDANAARMLRAAYEEWLDNQRGLKPDADIHHAWIIYVLAGLLGFDEESMRGPGHDLSAWSVKVPEHGETLSPDYVIINPERTADTRKARLLVQVLPINQQLDKPLRDRAWSASPAARMQELLHGSDVRLGLVTNGEQWMLVDAPRGETTGFASWYAQLWFDEPLILRAWTTLLGAHRFFGVPENETLEALLAESTQYQHEVTDQLGLQVRHAVELLVQAIDNADRDSHGALLAQMGPAQLYEAAVTVMMRLVFLLSAEERRLLPIDDPFYAEFYAVSTLQEQLRHGADQTGEEVLEYRHDAWPRLLAAFRAVHSGVYHDRWHMPAYGGGLFDPDRYPFLEGRGAQDPGTNHGLLISNRVVLHLLEALQMLRVNIPGAGAQTRRLSFRSLDIEQIGHVYEGLLDHTAVRAETPVAGLAGTAGKEPEIPLATLEAFVSPAGATAQEGDVPGDLAALPETQLSKLLAYLREETGRSENALKNALGAPPPEPRRAQQLHIACNNNEDLYRRILPWHGLIRDDDYGRPVIINAGSVYVTSGAARRATGTHYTPRSLTEPIVQHTLEPLVYAGPAAGKPREEWVLRSPEELLDLKICDMAMGSGAFLVQADRYLAERLVEAVEQSARKSTKKQGSRDGLAALREAQSPEERVLLARRLVADRCLYGVDKNPLAVEMAKLSLWLITMDKGKPFTFLDHALKCGDSLVGIHNLEQLRCWNIEGEGARQFSTIGLDLDIEQMIALRREIEAMPVLDIRDQQAKRYKLARADALAHDLKRAADMLIASYYNTLGRRDQETLRDALLSVARDGASLDEEWRDHADLIDPSSGSERPLRPFHWPLEFPEVFSDDDRHGFDGFVGNPPFIGGLRIRGSLGAKQLSYLKLRWSHARGVGDYSAYFFLRAFEAIRAQGTLGLIATNTISQGDTRELGLDFITQHGGTIYRANNNYRWPGQAAVVVNIVHICKGTYQGPYRLDGMKVATISSQLDDMRITGQPYRLWKNRNLSFIGTYILGLGFTMSPEEARALIAADPRNADVLFPYLNGQDLNSNPDQSPSRWVINFFDWPLDRSARGSWADSSAKQRRQWQQIGHVPADYPGQVAADYPDCLEIVRAKVFPERRINRNTQRREVWWRFTRPTIELYETISPLKQVLVVAQTSRTLAFTFVPNGWVYAMMTIVFAFDESWAFGLLQSVFHEKWVRKYASTMKQDLRYTPSDVFDTFPFPELVNCRIIDTPGKTLYQFRRQLMLDRWEGLTAIYNRFHNPGEDAVDIVRLRQLHVEMDYTVASAYDWSDLHLGHGFYETAQGIRYTIHDAARREVLTRLLALNHERYAEEVKSGLHGGKNGKKAPKYKTIKEQIRMFDE